MGLGGYLPHQALHSYLRRSQMSCSCIRVRCPLQPLVSLPGHTKPHQPPVLLAGVPGVMLVGAVHIRLGVNWVTGGTQTVTGDRHGGECLISVHWPRNGDIDSQQRTNWPLLCLKLCWTERKRVWVSVCTWVGAQRRGQRWQGSPPIPIPSSNHFFVRLSDHLLFSGVENWWENWSLLVTGS